MNRAMLFSLMESATTLRANSRLLESQLLEITGNAVVGQGGKIERALFGTHASPKALRKAAANPKAGLDVASEPANIRWARKRKAEGKATAADEAKLQSHTTVTARERIKSMVGDTRPGEVIGGKMGEHAKKMQAKGKHVTPLGKKTVDTSNYGKSTKAGGIKGNQSPPNSITNSEGAKHLTKGLASYAEGNHKDALGHLWNAAKSGSTHPAVTAALGIGAGHFLTKHAASRAAHATIAKYAIPAVAGAAAVGYWANND